MSVQTKSKIYLTSSIRTAAKDSLNPMNGFVNQIRKELPNPCKVLFVCSDPNTAECTDYRAEETKKYFERAGISFEDLWVLDGRNQNLASELVRKSDLIILSGGHVPTQNHFFQDAALGEHLKSFSGVVIAWSAGSMNSAETVYAHVELPGEAVDPYYKRFLPGLGLTKIMILPHYQLIRNDILDGMRIFEDVAYPDSFGRRFYCLVDGSYLYIHDGMEELRGEGYLIENGMIKQISKDGDVLML